MLDYLIEKIFSFCLISWLIGFFFTIGYESTVEGRLHNSSMQYFSNLESAELKLVCSYGKIVLDANRQGVKNKIKTEEMCLDETDEEDIGTITWTKTGTTVELENRLFFWKLAGWIPIMESSDSIWRVAKTMYLPQDIAVNRLVMDNKGELNSDKKATELANLAKMVKANEALWPTLVKANEALWPDIVRPTPVIQLPAIPPAMIENTSTSKNVRVKVPETPPATATNSKTNSEPDITKLISGQ